MTWLERAMAAGDEVIAEAELVRDACFVRNRAECNPTISLSEAV